MTWTVSVVPNRWRPFDQTNKSQTIDGQPAEDWALDCGPACLSSVLWYADGVEKLPDTIHDEGWGQGYIGPTDTPEMLTYMKAQNGIPGQVWHPTNAKALAQQIYQALYWSCTVTYLKLLSGQKHWCNAHSMTGGTTRDPFDNFTYSDPWGGVLYNEPYAQWAASLARYTDGNFYAVEWQVAPHDLTPETRLGP
jgi:hypothetical protein